MKRLSGITEQRRHYMNCISTQNNNGYRVTSNVTVSMGFASYEDLSFVVLFSHWFEAAGAKYATHSDKSGSFH